MYKMAFLLSEVFVYKSEPGPFVKLLVVNPKTSGEITNHNHLSIMLKHTVAFPSISRSSFHDCQCVLLQWGLVNSLELALSICARVTSTGVGNI